MRSIVLGIRHFLTDQQTLRRWLPAAASVIVMGIVALGASLTAQALLNQIQDEQRGVRRYALLDQKDSLETYRLAASQAPRTLADLLELTRDNRSQQERINGLRTDMQQLSDYAQRLLLAHDSAGRAAAVRLDDAGEGWRMMDRLMQVLANLLSNAAKFSPPGSTVQIRASRPNARVRIEVEDHGIGIPGEFHPHVFEKFAQADGSTSRRFEGTGLGLGITRQLVQARGGSIGFRSTAGCGTTFHIELPAALDDAGSAGRALPFFGGMTGRRTRLLTTPRPPRRYCSST